MASSLILDVDPEAIDRALDAYLQDSTNPATETVSRAQQHRLLPLWEDTGGCIGLLRSGEIVFFTWDEPSKLRPVAAEDEHGQRMVFAARANGARRYADIEGLAPVRDPNARVCPGCGGTGQLRGVPSNFACQCVGLGWVPW